MFFTSKDLKNLSKKSTEIACGKSRMVKKVGAEGFKPHSQSTKQTVPISPD